MCFKNQRNAIVIVCHVCVAVFPSVISCGDPGVPANGYKSGSDFTYGKVVLFECNPGYKLVGSTFRQCQLDGHWSAAQPSCSGQ